MRFKYETLESLFQKTDAFNERGLALFLKLKEAVWSKLETNSSTNEVQFIKRYEFSKRPKKPHNMLVQQGSV